MLSPLECVAPLGRPRGRERARKRATGAHAGRHLDNHLAAVAQFESERPPFFPVRRYRHSRREPPRLRRRRLTWRRRGRGRSRGCRRLRLADDRDRGGIDERSRSLVSCRVATTAASAASSTCLTGGSSAAPASIDASSASCRAAQVRLHHVGQQRDDLRAHRAVGQAQHVLAPLAPKPQRRMAVPRHAANVAVRDRNLRPR